MTPDEKRIAIAEFCGLDVKECPVHQSRYCCGRQRVPDYLNDLNAMQEAWSKLNQQQRDQFRLELLRLTVHKESVWMSGYHLDMYANATAAQRADALLKTIGKWKE